MKKIVLVMTAMFLVVFAKAQTGTLIITVNGVGGSDGIIVANLFRESDDIPKKPYQQAMGSIVKGTSVVNFQNLPFGAYAVIVFRDENSNGVLDHRWGFPNEPMGFSNEWKLSLFSGMPTFAKLRFLFSADHPSCEIKIY